MNGKIVIKHKEEIHLVLLLVEEAHRFLKKSPGGLNNLSV